MAAKFVLRYPARHGGQAGQASSGRRRRPGRAFFAPHSFRSWPPGASLDALLLLPSLERPSRCEAGCAAKPTCNLHAMIRYDFNAQRLFVDADLTEGATVACTPAQANYLRNVLRLDSGDAILVFNGRD